MIVLKCIVCLVELVDFSLETRFSGTFDENNLLASDFSILERSFVQIFLGYTLGRAHFIFLLWAFFTDLRGSRLTWFFPLEPGTGRHPTL